MGKRGSVLNISTVYYRTGEKYLSTLTIARVSYEEQQLSTAFTTRTWDPVSYTHLDVYKRQPFRRPFRLTGDLTGWELSVSASTAV